MRLKVFTVFAALTSLAGCSDAGEDVTDMIAWSKRNPPVSAATWQGVDKLVCTPKLLDVCGDKDCRAIDISTKPPIRLMWEPSTGRYQRCDDKGCDPYMPQVAYSGSFANVAVPESGTIFRLTASGEYREIANLRTDTFIYRGQCKEE